MRASILLIAFMARVDSFILQQQPIWNSAPLNLMSADEVIKIVEDAEKLWDEAHEARKTANALSDRAEEEAEAASDLAVESEARMREGAISLEKISGVDLATKANIDANSMLSRALAATEEADRLEALAEAKLKESEEALDQHLVDFPDSPLA